MVCLSVCQQGYGKTIGLIFMKMNTKGVTSAKKEPVYVWERIRLTGRIHELFLTLTSRDRAFAHGGGLRSPSALLVSYGFSVGYIHNSNPSFMWAQNINV